VGIEGAHQPSSMHHMDVVIEPGPTQPERARRTPPLTPVELPASGLRFDITIGLLVRWPAALLRLPMIADLFVRVLQGSEAEWSQRPPRTCRTASPSPP